jgi:hypothetical protein
MRFKCWLAEAFDPKKIHTNPSKATIEAKLKHSPHKELRYVHNTKTGDTHVGDAGHHTHEDVARETGEHEFTQHKKIEHEGGAIAYSRGHYHAGIVDDQNLDDIKRHSKGLKGYIQDLHKEW